MHSDTHPHPHSHQLTYLYICKHSAIYVFATDAGRLHLVCPNRPSPGPVRTSWGCSTPRPPRRGGSSWRASSPPWSAPRTPRPPPRPTPDPVLLPCRPLVFETRTGRLGDPIWPWLAHGSACILNPVNLSCTHPPLGAGASFKPLGPASSPTSMN